MNVLIPYLWLKQYLETSASPEKIAECLSLCSASVEKIEKIDNDAVFDIEITTNRVDMVGIAGLAREVTSVLPQFGIKTKLKIDPYQKFKIQGSEFKIINKGLASYLKVIIKDNSLCPRFSAILLDNVTMKPPPKIIQERLKKVGLRSLNNVIDVSNYLMHELGQPVHVFDYDKILGAKMILRESKKGETITTLDGKTHKLLGGDIVIEDGNARLIDLCGLMGGENSAVDQQTKRVLLFVQNYEPSRIRKTAMSLGIRTEAATLFEKSVDPEMVMPTILRGVQLIKETAGGKATKEIIDIYPNPYKPMLVKVPLQLIKDRLGIIIQSNEVIKILNSLGFQSSVISHQSSVIQVSVPSWRSNDVAIPEDIVEEVARIYGYHNLPSALPPLYQQPVGLNINFKCEQKVKQILKNWGLSEVYTYSMQAEEQIKNLNLDCQKHLKIKNPLSSEWLYMRISLLPSLLSTIAQNLEKKGKIKIFELANVYLPQKEKLPIEQQMLAIALTGDNFYNLKGICEGLFAELNIEEKYLPFPDSHSYWLGPKTALICLKNNPSFVLGCIGELKLELINNFSIKEKVVIADLYFGKIAKISSNKKAYSSISKYPPIIEDLTFTVQPNIYVDDLIQAIKRISLLVKEVAVHKIYKNTRTFRITYLSPKKNLTDKEIAVVRKKIVLDLSSKFKAALKGTIKI